MSGQTGNQQLRQWVDELGIDGIFIAGVDGRYEDVNPAGCAMLGYSRDELSASR